MMFARLTLCSAAIAEAMSPEASLSRTEPQKQPAMRSQGLALRSRSVRKDWASFCRQEEKRRMGLALMGDIWPQENTKSAKRFR